MTFYLQYPKSKKSLILPIHTLIHITKYILKVRMKYWQIGKLYTLYSIFWVVIGIFLFSFIFTLPLFLFGKEYIFMEKTTLLRKLNLHSMLRARNGRAMGQDGASPPSRPRSIMSSEHVIPKSLSLGSVCLQCYAIWTDERS